MNVRLAGVLLVLGLLFAWQHEGELRLAWRKAQPGYQAPGVVLLATSWCGYCKKMRELFDDKGIVYTEYDVETSAEGKALMQKVQGEGVPVVVAGSAVVYGYDPDGVLAVLAEQ